MTDPSKMRNISIGIVAEHKPRNTRLIKVVPIEIVPLISGDIYHTNETSELTGVNRLDEQYTVSVKNSTTITAEWLPHYSNRITPPDLRRGERVYIQQAADEDKYYWTETGMDDDLRRLETIIHAISATSKEFADLQPGQNMYSFEWSTHDQHATFRTTDVEGELTTYKAQFNTKTGDFYLVDKQRNIISINSTEHQILTKNADGCSTHHNKLDLNVNVPRDLTREVGRDVRIEVGRDVRKEIGRDVDIDVGHEIQVNAGDDITIVSGDTITLRGALGVNINSGGGIGSNLSRYLRGGRIEQNKRSL